MDGFILLWTESSGTSAPFAIHRWGESGQTADRMVYHYHETDLDDWQQRRADRLALAMEGRKCLQTRLTHTHDECEGVLGNGHREVQRVTSWWSTLSTGRGPDAENWHGGYRQATAKKGTADAENWVAPAG